MHDADDERAVGEVVEYCRTQAGLLAGRVETMAAEAETLIEEIDEGVADLRASLAERETELDADSSTEAADSPDGDTPQDGDDSTDEDVSDLAAAESDLQRKQATVEATETRMRLFQELASDYLDLADDLLAEHDAGDLDADDAVRRVVSFEAERDAPAYFEERETLVEVARRGSADADADTDGDTDTDTDADADGAGNGDEDETTDE
ncbi:hypothetical protein [Halobaculum marinum]|uniref:Uncharacterized protein n=1 Tax=Halobaculum marinum TaxID=3031996 RepID=A0ABD5X181_9EURY|nr:hypothetical protein [Halobaculum sp. DT55]